MPNNRKTRRKPTKRKTVHPTYSIAQQISSARKAKGLTQKDLSEKTGTVECKISDYETARTTPSLATIQKLSSALGDFFIDAENVWIDTDNSIQKKGKKQYDEIKAQSEEIKVLRSENAKLRRQIERRKELRNSPESKQ